MTAASLFDLSPEILLCIAEQLCMHCRSLGENKFMASDTRSTQQSCITALSNLSKTCRTLRYIAQPILYHYPSQAIKLAPFARTVIERADLGQSVRELDLGVETFPIDYEEVVSMEDQAFFRQEWAKLQPNLARDSDDIICKWDDVGNFIGEENKNNYQRDNFLGLLMLSHTPNVEKLLVRLGYGTKFVEYPHEMLSSLTTLQVQHADTEGGFHFRSIAGIMRAAPNLKHIEAQMAVSIDLDDGKVHNENVTKVSFFETVLDGEEFSGITRGFPTLEILHYEGGGATVSYETPATPAEMSRALLRRRDTLREVHINMSESEDSFPDGIEDSDVMLSLIGMKALEILVLDSFCIYVEMDDETSTNGAHLINFLPKSIQVFGLVKPHEHLNRDILRLAISAREKFPALKKVMFKDLGEEQLDLFKPAFEQGGVEFVVDDRLNIHQTNLPPNW